MRWARVQRSRHAPRRSRVPAAHAHARRPQDPTKAPEPQGAAAARPLSADDVEARVAAQRGADTAVLSAAVAVAAVAGAAASLVPGLDSVLRRIRDIHVIVSSTSAARRNVVAFARRLESVEAALRAVNASFAGRALSHEADEKITQVRGDLDEAHAMISQYVDLNSGARMWHNARYADAFAELDKRIQDRALQLSLLLHASPASGAADQKSSSPAAEVYQDEDETNERYRAMHRQKTMHSRETNVWGEARAITHGPSLTAPRRAGAAQPACGLPAARVLRVASRGRGAAGVRADRGHAQPHRRGLRARRHGA